MPVSKAWARWAVSPHMLQAVKLHTHRLQFYVKSLKGEIKKKTEERFFKKKEEKSQSLNRQDCDGAQILAHQCLGFIWKLGQR